MKNLMKAAVYYGPRDLRVEEIPIPKTGPNDILLKVIACGICGSDVHSYLLGLYLKPGQIMGHEFVGEVVKIGKNVKDIHVGERATGSSVKFCGKCYWCKTGEFFYCPNLFPSVTGYGKPGAFAEYVVISAPTLGFNYHRIPPEIDDISATTIEPVSIAAKTIELCQPKASDKVVVLGAGLIGNAIMQAMKAAPVSKVVVTDISKKRLKAAKDLGADVVIDAGRENVLERVKKEVGIGRHHFGEGGMADIVVECAGAPATIQDSFEIVRSCGTIAFVGLPEKDALLNTTKIIHKSPRIAGVFGGNAIMAIDLLQSKKVNTRSLVTHIFPLAKAKEAFEMQAKADQAIKVVIQG